MAESKEEKAARDKAYYEANKEKILARCKDYRRTNRDKLRAYHKAYYKGNREKVKGYVKAYKEANKETVAAAGKAYREANKETIATTKKAYYEANKNKLLTYFKAYKEANKEKVAVWKANRRALKRKQIPVHLRDCPHEKKRLVEIYKLRNIISEATGVQHHVDHMWPLADGGPHWSGNLQIIPAEENLSKHASVCEDTKTTIIKSLYTFESERSI